MGGVQKIPTLFKRDPDDMRRVLPEVTPGCEWVLAGEGVATRKYDGTCVLLDENGKWWARREVKQGKPIPPGWTLVERDGVTGKMVGWEPIANSPFAKFHAEALAATQPDSPGTYELIGEKINGNPEQITGHLLVKHGCWVLSPPDGSLDIDSLKAWVCSCRYEGVVWHHPDGRMAKLKARDFARAQSPSAA